jgi:hypothetical protein
MTIPMEKTGYTEAEQQVIRTAAARILEHPSFRASERSSRLFKFLLESTLRRDLDGLKERQIGHEVFGREITYDTAVDPIVRNAASETRKRLRQYDAEIGASQPVRVLLPSGTYVLEFRFHSESEQQEQPAASIADPAVQEAASATMPSSTAPGSRPNDERLSWRLRTAYGVIAALVACCLILSIALFRRPGVTQGTKAVTPDYLWAPMLYSGKEVFISLGHAGQPPQSNSALNLASGLQPITVADLKAYTNISGFLQLHDQPFQMRTDTDTTLLDLRSRPVVLIGNHNNEWAVRLTQNVRFRFDFDDAHAGSPDRVFSIIDTQNPEQKIWQTPIYKIASAGFDYAVVGRFYDPVTDGVIMYIAGAGPGGTEAASEFITQDRFLRMLPEKLSNPRTNFEAVLRTPVIAGLPGSPEMIASDIH